MPEKKLITVNANDAKELTNSIVEVEAYKELYEKAAIQVNYSPKAFEDLLKGYMSALKLHKSLWRDILDRYIGAEDASYYRDLYKFDIYKKLIFLPTEVFDDESDED